MPSRKRETQLHQATPVSYALPLAYHTSPCVVRATRKAQCVKNDNSSHRAERVRGWPTVHNKHHQATCQHIKHGRRRTADRHIIPPCAKYGQRRRRTRVFYKKKVHDWQSVPFSLVLVDKRPTRDHHGHEVHQTRCESHVRKVSLLVCLSGPPTSKSVCDGPRNDTVTICCSFCVCVHHLRWTTSSSTDHLRLGHWTVKPAHGVNKVKKRDK